MSQKMAPQPIPSFEAGMRKLWTDHVIWTRQYITSAVADMPDAGAAAARLLLNQEHIGTAIVPFYGKAAGDRLTNLLRQHIMIAVDLVAAAKADDKAKFAQEDQKWTKNAEEIATFLSNANPNWGKADLVDLLGQHLSLTKAETVARLTKSWEDDVKAFDDIFTEILTVADALSRGIIKQFPQMFRAQ
jgi:prophage DNA circulation protein